MVYHLNDIKSTVQTTADAIAAALKIEVEIADADLIRVVGTGKYRNQCDRPMDDGFVYKHVLTTGAAVIIDNPGFNELCQPCPCSGNCQEYAEVAIPIRVDDQIIGVIGLVSFNEEQTKRLMDNKESLLLFLEKMADLLGGIEEGHPVTNTLEETYKGLFGKDPVVDKWTFSTNGVSIMGRYGIPCIGFGPGHEDQAHAPNERTWKKELVDCAAMYAMIPLLYAQKYADLMPKDTENLVKIK